MKNPALNKLNRKIIPCNSSIASWSVMFAVAPFLMLFAILISIANPSVMAQPPVGNTPPVVNPPANSTQTPATTAQTTPRTTEDEKTPLNSDISPELLISKNLMTPEILDKYKKENLAKNFRTAMRNGNLGGSDADVIKKYAKWSVYRLSQPDERKKMRSFRLDIVNTPEAYDPSPAKDLYLKEVSARCSELMDNHLAVRIQAAMILGELNSEKPNPFKAVPPIPYFGNTDILAKILSDPSQHQAVKLQIVIGIERISKYGATLNKPDVNLRYTLAKAVVAELENGSKKHWWYKKNLIRSLPELKVVYDSVTRKPFVTEILVSYVRNKNEDKLVRAEAAKSLGRIQLDGSHRLDLIVHEILKFAEESAVAYNQNLTDPTYRDCFWTLYVAFHPEDAEELKKQYGLLSQVEKVTLKTQQPVVQNGYNILLTVVNTIFNENAPAPGVPAKPIGVEKIKAFNDYLKANIPAEKSIHPSSAPLK